jgi:hypothetical protein
MRRSQSMATTQDETKDAIDSRSASPVVAAGHERSG